MMRIPPGLVVVLALAACGNVTNVDLEITPGSVTIPPRGSQTFTSSVTTAITWSLSTNASGGSIDAETGEYTAGPTPSVMDVVTAAQTGGKTATATVTVGPPITIGPSDLHVHSGSHRMLTATGGSGAGFTWTITNNQSTGSLDATTGDYQAGLHSGVIDIVSVTDGLGNSAMANITVRPLQIYIGDQGNHRIVRVDDMTGANFIAFGTSGAGVGQFARPVNVFVDDDDKIYIADEFNQRVERMDDMLGTNFVSFGTSGAGVGQFGGPIGITVDKTGKIYVADFDGNRIERMDDMSGTNFVSFGTPGAGVGQFQGPCGIGIDDAGKIYIVEQNGARIDRMDDMTGTNFVSFGDSTVFQAPDGIAVAGGKIFIADTGHGRVVRIDDMGGSNLVSFGTSGSAVGQFSVNTTVAVDGFGRIYVGEFSNNRISRMDDITGAGIVTFGAVGTGTNQFTNPYGVFAK